MTSTENPWLHGGLTNSDKGNHRLVAEGAGLILYPANGRGRFGGQIARGHPKAFAQPRQPLFALPALRELECACRVSIL